MVKNARKKIIHKARHTGEKLLPPKSWRRNVAKGILLKTGVFTKIKGDSYTKWYKKHEATYSTEPVEDGPLLSIVVPCFNTPRKYLHPLIEGVKAQTYQNWQLCLLDGGSHLGRADEISHAAASDERILYKRSEENLGIAGNTNAAIELAEGEFIIFLDHDDTLAPFALAEVAQTLVENPKADLIYSDEDLQNEKGTKRFNPFFKGDWSPDLLLSHNYITHLVAARASIVRKLGGIREGVDGSQDHDFLLRFTENTNNIVHIPKVLYHWRMAESSTAKNINNKQYALNAGVKAVSDALKRRGIKAKVDFHPSHTAHYRIHYTNDPNQSVHVVIAPDALVMNGGTWLEVFLERTKMQKNYQLHIPKEYAELTNQHKAKTYTQENGSAAASAVAQKNPKDLLIYIDQPLIPISDQAWIDDLIGPLQQTETVATTGMVLDNDGLIVDFGLAKQGVQFNQIFRDMPDGIASEIGFVDSPRNFSAITGQVFAMRCSDISDSTFVISPQYFASLTQKGRYITGWPYVKFMVIPNKFSDELLSPNVIKHRNHYSFDNFFESIRKSL